MPTRKDVANLAAVSPTLVSYYINSSGYVGKENKVKIQHAIEKLNYRPNLIAKSLKLKRTNQLVLICNEIRNPFHSELVFGTTQLAYSKGFIMLFSNIVDDPKCIERICGFQVSGVIIASDKVDSKHINEIVRMDIPVVILTNINMNNLDNKVSQIKVDGYKAIRKLLRHVISKGHKNIAWISSCPSSKYNHIDRKTSGFLDEAMAQGLKEKSLYFIYDTASAIKAYEKVKELLKYKNAPTAYICANDAVAIGVLRAAHDNGLKVPEDIVVTGFDNSENSKLSIPALTTVDLCASRMSEVAVNMMLQKLSGKNVNSISVEGEVIIRDST
jgi:LacI family transcriptional regulator